MVNFSSFSIITIIICIIIVLLIITIVVKKFIRDGCCKRNQIYINLDQNTNPTQNQILDYNIQIIIDTNNRINKYSSEKIDLL